MLIAQMVLLVLVLRSQQFKWFPLSMLAHACSVTQLLNLEPPFLFLTKTLDWKEALEPVRDVTVASNYLRRLREPPVACMLEFNM